jgi:hypothetical protein
VNSAALGQAIVAAVGIAISPVAVAAVILLLISPRAKAASIGFLTGWVFGIIVAVTAFALLSAVVPTRVPGPARTVLAIVQLVVGALLLVLAAIQWRAPRLGSDALQRTPTWMRAIDRATPPIAFAVGLAMAINPPNLLLSLTGGIALGSSGLVGWGMAAAIAVFAFVAASTVLAPVVAYVIAAERLRVPLETFRLWLIRRNSAILTAVFAVVGLFAVGQGISSLWSG